MGGESGEKFDAVMSSIPTHDDFCSGKIKVLAYIIFDNGGQSYLWSDKERDGEITDSDLIDIEKHHGIKIDRLAIFKLHKVFDGTDRRG